MKWILKAVVQNAVALLPDRYAQPVYYELQTRFGELKKPRYRMRFDAAAEMARLLADRGGLAGKTVFEVGTGRTVDVPVALWLMGAERVVTLDLNPYLRSEIIQGGIRYLDDHWDTYRERFVEHADPTVVDERFEKLRRFRSGRFDLNAFFELTQIDYRAPGDASAVALADNSIDVHMSFVVLQHIPKPVLGAILKEGARLLKKDGHMLHVVNTTDHFSHMDGSLTTVNFLRFSERQWQLIGGNRFMFHNRLRADDYTRLFDDAGLSLVHTEEETNERALDALRSGFRVHDDWRGPSPERLAVSRFQAVLEPKRAAESH